MVGLIAKKLGMTRFFDEKTGNSVAVTVLEAGPCVVTQVKTEEIDGYTAVQLGFGQKKEKRTSKAILGHLAKSAAKPLYLMREFRDFVSAAPLKLGDEVKADVFSVGDQVSISGISKGKGFAGVVKRHHFNGGPVTHGQSDRLRAPGSLGQSSYPSRVYKGLRMAGRLGNEKVTVSGLKVVKVDIENNLLLIKGAIPGANQGYVLIKK